MKEQHHHLNRIELDEAQAETSPEPIPFEVGPDGRITKEEIKRLADWAFKQGLAPAVSEMLPELEELGTTVEGVEAEDFRDAEPKLLESIMDRAETLAELLQRIGLTPIALGTSVASLSGYLALMNTYNPVIGMPPSMEVVHSIMGVVTVVSGVVGVFSMIAKSIDAHHDQHSSASYSPR